MRLHSFSYFSQFLTVWRCRHHDRAHCAALRRVEQTALTVLVPLSVSAGFEHFGLSLQLAKSLAVQQQHEREIILDDGNRSYLWGPLKGLCTFMVQLFLLKSLVCFFPSCWPTFHILGSVAAKYGSLLLCPTCSSSFWDTSFSLPKCFLSLPVPFIVFSVQDFPPCFEVGIIGGCWTRRPAVVTFVREQKRSSIVKSKVWIWPTTGRLKCCVHVLWCYVSRAERTLKQALWEGILGEL